MPELPDITVYVEALERHLTGHVLERVRVVSPALVRSFDPPLSAVHGRRVLGFGAIGKRIVWHLDGDLHLVLHLMVAGRLRWRPPGAAVPRKGGLAAFDFAHGTVVLTEMAKQKRATLLLVRGEAALRALDPGGIDPLTADLAAFGEVLRRERHTLKRTLTDPRLLSGIGNAYSDEILHRARLSPVQLTSRLSDEEVARLHRATRQVLVDWTERLRAEVGEGFPDKVTAFREGMAVHGRHGQPCPVCGTPIQRIARADNETNYCPTCQTGGKLLRDRALSRLLREDWPATLEELQARKAERRSK